MESTRLLLTVEPDANTPPDVLSRILIKLIKSLKRMFLEKPWNKFPTRSIPDMRRELDGAYFSDMSNLTQYTQPGP